MEIVRRLPPRFPPGIPGRAYYSNANYRLLGAIIESVTGKAMAANFEERIFAPLGLQLMLSKWYTLFTQNEMIVKRFFALPGGPVRGPCPPIRILPAVCTKRHVPVSRLRRPRQRLRPGLLRLLGPRVPAGLSLATGYGYEFLVL